jgi:hypothetical protein
MRRTRIEIYKESEWTEDDVRRVCELHKRSGATCEMKRSESPKGWRLTVVAEYP